MPAASVEKTRNDTMATQNQGSRQNIHCAFDPIMDANTGKNIWASVKASMRLTRFRKKYSARNCTTRFPRLAPLTFRKPILNDGYKIVYPILNKLEETEVIQNRYEILLFLNSDTRMLKGSLDVLVNGFRGHPGLGAVSCHEISPAGETVPGCCSTTLFARR